MAYATLDDVISRSVREFSYSEQTVIETLLSDAALMIDAAAPNASEDAKKTVSCRMVIRAMGDGESIGVPVGATQGTMAAGGYSQSWTMGTGVTGELYLGKADKALLGVGNHIGAYSPLEGMVVPCD